MTTWSHWPILELLEYVVPKILLAMICGGIIGLERELKNKPAGIKTNILICVGSTLYTALSILISTRLSDQNHFGDPARVSAQIVSGIGFLGGGAIIQSRGTVLGLTTAATIWVVAAIGICIGTGYADIGLICSVAVVGILVTTNWFEDRILGRELSFACEIVIEDQNGNVRQIINQSLQQNNLTLNDFDITDRDGYSSLSFKYSGHRRDHKKFILDLWGIPGIREVRQK